MPSVIVLAALTGGLVFFPIISLAHNVVATVYASGDRIEGEIGFSNGEMAADALVEVFDAAGTKLGETRTDADGLFFFTPSAPATHVFRANLGAGHVAEVRLTAAELPAALASAAPADDTAASTGLPTTVPALNEAQRRLVAETVRNELRPLRQELTAYKNQNDLQTILGGIGYIVGVFGLWFFYAARRQHKA